MSSSSFGTREILVHGLQPPDIVVSVRNKMHSHLFVLIRPIQLFFDIEGIILFGVLPVRIYIIYSFLIDGPISILVKFTLFHQEIIILNQCFGLLLLLLLIVLFLCN